MDRRFPVLMDDRERRAHPAAPQDVPWAFLDRHEYWASRNHCGQTLRRLAERGGLCPSEMVAIAEGRRWQWMDLGAALARLTELIDAWALSQPAAEQEPTP